MYLTDEQRSKLSSLARSEGVSEAEVIRRILDRALGSPDRRGARLAAVDESAGVLADAPDWPEWLSRVRRRGAARRLKELGL